MTRRAPSGPRVAHWLRRAVLAIGAAALLVLPQFSSNAAFIGVAGLPGPLTVLVVGLVMWLMLVLLVASWVAESRATLPVPWLAIPAGLFVLAAAISTAVAADKSSAVVRAAEMTGLWVGAFALVQAIRSDAERRFLLAALVAAGFVAATAAVYQAVYSLPLTWDYFQAHRAAVLAQQGIEPGSWMEQVFVGRFTGGVQASLGHPNVLASLLTLALFVAVGLVREKWSEARTRGARALAAAIAVVAAVCAIGILLTQSRAGLAAVLVGLYWLAVAWRVRRPRTRVLLYAAPLVAGAIALAAATQVDHPAVVAAVKTLRYRLDYWQATLQVLRSYWETGVGLENFGHHYVAHKVPWAPEEVSDPHNMVLSTWSQLGLAGVTALALLAVATIRAWARRARAGAGREDDAAGRSQPLPALLVPAMLVAGPAVVFLFARQGHGEAEGLVAQAMLAVGVLALTAMVIGLASAEVPSRLVASGRPLRSLHVACIVALAAFALQEQIGTAILSPPTAWAMLVVVGASLGPVREEPGGARGTALSAPLKFLLVVAAMVLVFVYVTWLVVPVGRERHLLARAQQSADPAERDEVLRAAAKANPLAWEPAVLRGTLWQEEASRRQGPLAAMDLERAMAAYEEALGRHGRLRRAHLALARCQLAAGGALENPASLERARLFLEQAAALYPTDIQTRLRLADVIDRLGDDRAALGAYEEVLRLDRLMPEPGRRLKADVRSAVAARGEKLRGLVTDPGPKR